MRSNYSIYSNNAFLCAGVSSLLEEIFTNNKEASRKKHYFLLFSDLSLTDIPRCCSHLDRRNAYIVVGDLKISSLLCDIELFKMEGFIDISMPLTAMRAELSRLIARESATETARKGLLVHLTASERTILRYIVKGVTPASIARWTGISTKKISTQKRSIMKKLNVSSNQQLYIKTLLLQNPVAH